MKEKGEKAPQPPLTCTRPSGRHQRRQRGGSSARLGTRSSRRTCSERGKEQCRLSGTRQQATAPIRKRDSPADGLAVGAAVGDAVGAAVGDAVGAVRRECKAGRGETKGWVSGVRELKTGREERESMKREAQKPRKDTKRGGGI